jgi:hypothetical protein
MKSRQHLLDRRNYSYHNEGLMVADQGWNIFPDQGNQEDGCPQRVHHFQVPRASHRGDFRPKRFGDLHGECSHTTGGAINQNLLPWLNVSIVPQSLQGGHRRQL